MPTVKPTRKPASGRSTKKSRLMALLKFDAGLLAEYRQVRSEVSGESSNGCALVGLDEVGRGSLIGPVVGGAVILPASLSASQKRLLKWLDDSKKLTPDVRAEVAAAIHEFCYVGLGEASKAEVDRLNIHHASLLALHRAHQALCDTHALSGDDPDQLLLLDGRAVMPDYPRARQRAIVKGDGLSAAIAAASVVAKEARDSMIRTLALDFPGYGWEANMGYGTPAHLDGIRKLGLTPHHRVNFKTVQGQLSLSVEPARP